jgi:hypothetical protein
MTDQEPAPQQDPQPQAQPAALSAVPLRTNAMADIIAEDHMRGMLNKATNSGVYQPYVSQLVPRANHSPFGDFPKEFIKKQSKAEDFSIDVYEKSQAASASSMD